ncbi:MAG: hypothetical protein MUD14_29075 [Hydrococcus sp. Prado102]|jgi:hypothetical protein|nr:hypothetical protein [Hydrococcus sp. Prado102]
MTDIEANLKRIWNGLANKVPEVTLLLQNGLLQKEIDTINFLGCYI